MRRCASLVAVLALVGCHRSTTTEVNAVLESTGPGSVGLAPADAAVTLLPARCRRTSTALSLGSDPDDLELGDAIAYAGGYALGLVHRTGAGRVAAIALLRRDPVALTRVVDLGPTLGDAPPPRIGVREGALVAASYVRSQPPKAADSGAETLAREVSVYSIGADGVTGAISVPQQRDDSLAFDLATQGPTGVLVWDEATSAPRGVVKAAVFTKEQPAPSHDVSPPESDAESPRVVPAGAGFLVFWIARRPEAGSSPDASGPEAIGEARSLGWLEAIAVDAHGEPAGPVRRLTSQSGHVSAYDVVARDVADGSPGGTAPAVFVVARDDGETVDGSGGVLLRMRVGLQPGGEGADAPILLPTDGLGRGAPVFVSSPAPLSSVSPLALAWVGRDEQARLVPLDSAGAPAGPPSFEDALNDARPLLFAGPAAAGSAEVLVATPSDATAQLRVFACAR
jgi:hypothetical protein